jgi:hypothetical protein
VFCRVTEHSTSIAYIYIPRNIHEGYDESYTLYLVTVKVKFTLEQAMKAQRGSRGIALLFL